MSVPNRSDIREAVEANKDRIVEWTQHLIRFPSENRPPVGQERDAQRWYAEQCESLDLEVTTFSPATVPGIEEHPHWLPGRDYDDGRENVVATWTGGSGEKRVLLSGHMDVAPYEPDHWSICRPFEPAIREGRLYGRGSADMKGGLAAAFWAIKILKELSFEPNGTVYCESVVDEEFAGGNGTLASRLRGFNGDLAVYMEPSGMELCPAGLGAFLGDLRVTGDPGMPYTGHELSNPIFGMSRVIELFKEWLERWRARNSHPLFTEQGRRLNLVLWNLDSNVSGGSAQMGIPQAAKVSWIVWCYPGTDEEEFYDQLRSFFTDAFERDPDLEPFTFELERTYHFVEPWETPHDDPMVVALQNCYTDYVGTPPAVLGAPFSSDLAVYGKYGNMPAVILGPRGDNLHGPDEWVLIEDILSLTGIFASFIADYCGR